MMKNKKKKKNKFGLFPGNTHYLVIALGNNLTLKRASVNYSIVIENQVNQKNNVIKPALYLWAAKIRSW